MFVPIAERKDSHDCANAEAPSITEMLCQRVRTSYMFTYNVIIGGNCSSGSRGERGKYPPKNGSWLGVIHHAPTWILIFFFFVRSSWAAGSEPSSWRAGLAASFLFTGKKEKKRNLAKSSMLAVQITSPRPWPRQTPKTEPPSRCYQPPPPRSTEKDLGKRRKCHHHYSIISLFFFSHTAFLCSWTMNNRLDVA